jgi:cell wall-associated NlpC family hydrolase
VGRLAALIATVVLGATVLVVATPSPAHAAAVFGQRVVAAARAQKGKPYRSGARGPRAFDCSGLTGWAARRAGAKLPRTADAQYHRVRKVSRRNARPGDLVFWLSGGHAYHVGVYAGRNRVWHAPRPGQRVRRVKIWTRDVRFGRIRRADR